MRWSVRFVGLGVLLSLVTAVAMGTRSTSTSMTRHHEIATLDRTSRVVARLIPHSRRSLHTFSASSLGRLRGGADAAPVAATADPPATKPKPPPASPSSFQVRLIASIVLSAALAAVVHFGKASGLQWTVLLLTPGLFYEAITVVIHETPALDDTPPPTVNDPNQTQPVLQESPSHLQDYHYTNPWWWFAAYSLALSGSAGETLTPAWEHPLWSRLSDRLASVAQLHLASFAMIVTGLMDWIVRLNRNASSPSSFRIACRELAVIHLGILLTLVPATVWIMAISKFGLEWVLYTALLVILNDTTAYIFGKRLGKRPLLPSISPNKTWEGWGGALVSTMVLSVPLFASLFGDGPFNFASYNRPAFVLALYCSFISPFGGFLASTVKRAYGKKDFGSLIAGHGGLIDRLDCQLLTAPFVYLFLNVVADPITDVNSAS